MPGEEVYEFAPYKTEVVSNEPDMSEVARQMAHARAQLELASRYPGRRKIVRPLDDRDR